MSNPTTAMFPLHKQITTLWVVVCAGIAFLFGCGLIFVAGHWEYFKESLGIAAMVREMGSVIAAASILAVFWDLLLRRTFAQELFSHAGLAHDLRAGDLRSVSLVEDFQSGIEWDALLGRGKTFSFFFAYAASWRHSRESSFRYLAQRPDVSVQFFLPNPENGDLMKQLANNFGMPVDELTAKVLAAISEIEQIFVNGKAKVKVSAVNIVPSLPFYRFDDVALFTLPKYESGRGGVVVIRFGPDGFLWHFLSRQIESLKRTAKTMVAINRE